MGNLEDAINLVASHVSMGEEDSAKLAELLNPPAAASAVEPAGDVAAPEQVPPAEAPAATEEPGAGG